MGIFFLNSHKLEDQQPHVASGYRIGQRCIRASMHNIRSAGQMWPAKVFDLAQKAQNVMHLACYLIETPLE